MSTVKLIVLFLIFPVISKYSSGQEGIPDIKGTYSGISGRMVFSIFQQDQSQFEKLVSILNLDVLEYYKLKNQYNTDQKIEAFRESDDYNTRYSELQNERSQLLASTWFLDFVPDYSDEKSISIEYNPGTKSFAVSNNVSYSSFYDHPGFLQFDHILIQCPTGMGVSKRNVNYECVDVVEQTISFEITSKELISKIEKNRKSLRLLFVFSITGLSPIPGRTSDSNHSDFCLLTQLRQVIIYNSSDSEIYFTFK